MLKILKKFFPDKPVRYLTFYHGICYHKDTGMIHFDGVFVSDTDDFTIISSDIESIVMQDWPTDEGYFNHEFPKKICLGKGAVRMFLDEMEEW